VGRRSRLAIATLFLLAIATGLALVLFAQGSCATDLPAQPCSAAGTNRVVVVSLIGLTVCFTVAPFAFLAEFAARRRIVYRGAWGRALRRGLLAGLAIAALAGLRVGGALNVPAALFVVVMAGLVEWLAIRRFDVP
jgi:hypothetical protein